MRAPAKTNHDLIIAHTYHIAIFIMLLNLAERMKYLLNARIGDVSYK